jgi:hypothetical protein
LRFCKGREGGGKREEGVRGRRGKEEGGKPFNPREKMTLNLLVCPEIK